MPIEMWFLALASVAVAVRLLWPFFRSHDGANARYAALVGVPRIWGETDESLRRRCLSQSRWPFKEETPVLRWWGRLFARARGGHK